METRPETFMRRAIAIMSRVRKLYACHGDGRTWFEIEHEGAVIEQTSSLADADAAMFNRLR